MNVAIEVTAACRRHPSGIARYTTDLVEAMLREKASVGGEISLGCRVSRWRERREGLGPRGAPSFWIQEPWWPLRRPWDVVHGTDARVPAWRGVARVATLHDVFSLLFDEFAGDRFRRRKHERYRELAARCHRIISVSEATKQDFLRFVDYPAEHIDVVPHGVRDVFRPRSAEETRPVLRRHGIERPYLLFVGEISVRKNVARLLEAYELSAAHRDFDLVLAGKRPPSEEGALAGARSWGDSVKLLGWVGDSELPVLYSGAAALVFATRYEGFGLPILEAMASGAAVVTSDSGGAAEVAGRHAVLVDPSDAGSIAVGIDRALDTTPEAQEASRRHAASFTWAACASRVRDVYARAVEHARSGERPA